MKGQISLAALVTFAVVTSAACGSEDEANGSLTCEEGWNEVVSAVGRGWEDPHACASDEDCVVDSGQLGGECGDGVHLALCGWVVHRDSIEAFREHVRETAEPICARIAPRVSCGPLCPAIEPACSGGRCIDRAARDI